MDIAPVILSSVAKRMIEDIFLPQVLREFTNRIFFKKLTPEFAESSVLELLRMEGWDKFSLYDLLKSLQLDNAVLVEVLNALKIGYVTIVDVLSKIDSVLEKNYLDFLKYLGMPDEVERVRKAIELEKAATAAIASGKTAKRDFIKSLYIALSKKGKWPFIAAGLGLLAIVCVIVVKKAKRKREEKR